jgi:DNA processing protein
MTDNLCYPETPDALAWFALSLVSEPGSNRLWNVFRECNEDVFKLYDLFIPDKNESDAVIERVITACRRAQIGIVTYKDKNYPRSLKEIYNPPAALYYTGDVSVLTGEPCISIVGARHSSDYTVGITNKTVKALLSFEPNYIIVSGFAVGTDIAAHLSAVRAGGRTIAVRASGLDYAYPRENMAYAEEIAGSGVFISEYPPGTKPIPNNFLIRNRLIAALSDGVLITQAGLQSGALSTANLALDYGKDVFVIPPHNISAPEFQGNIELLRDGAIPVYGTRDILVHNRNFVSYLLAEASRQSAEDINVKDVNVKDVNGKVVSINDEPADPKSGSAELLTDEQRFAPQISKLSTDTASINEPARTVYDLIKGCPGKFNTDVLTHQLDRDPDEIIDILAELEMNNFIFRAPNGSFY